MKLTYKQLHNYHAHFTWISTGAIAAGVLVYVVGIILSSSFAATSYSLPALSTETPAAEDSGLVASRQYPGVFWWHRDGGTSTVEKPRAAIYAVKFDSDGQLQPVRGTDKFPFFLVNNVKNSNWEDIALDDNNNIWIGEIGANKCDSTGQKIYKVAEPDPTSTSSLTILATYGFKFPNPPAGCNTYNSESMFWLDGNIYIFAKTTNSPVYRMDLPTGNSGTATLTKLGTLAGGISNISGSSPSDDYKRLMVESHGAMHVYTTPNSNLRGDAWVKDVISRSPAYQASFNCNCTLGKGTVEGGSFRRDSHDLAFVSEGKQIYYAKPADYGDTATPLPTDITAPTVQLTAPLNGASVSGTVALQATATDNIGVTQVEFYVDDKKVTTDTTVAYTYNWDTTAIANGSHTVYAKAYDAANNMKQSATSTVTVSNAANDTTPPTAPSALTSPSQTASSVALSWVASTDNVGVTGYRIYVDGTQVGTTASTQYVAAGLLAASGYVFGVAAVDAAGNVSAITTLTKSTTTAADTQPPTAPANVTANSITSTGATVNWGRSTDNVAVSGYNILVNGLVVGSVDGTATSYQLTGLASQIQYQVAVTARDAAGNTSAWSNVYNLTTAASTDITPPSVPQAVQAIALSGRQVTLRWQASADNVVVSGYRIVRINKSNGNVWTTDTQNGTTFGDATVSPGTAYSYQVSALDAAGNASAASAAAVVTTSYDEGVVSGTTGLATEYFAGTTLSGGAKRQASQTVNFDWGTAAPVAGIPADNFSARFTGRVLSKEAGNYVFTTSSDDGVRLWIDGKLVIDDWKNHGTTENKATVSLAKNMRYNIKLEYYEATGGANLKLFWKSPAMITRQIVPSAQLSPDSFGLMGSYYNQKDLSGTAYDRMDPNLNFDWGIAAPRTSIATDNFGVRWSGQVNVETAGSYALYLGSDDGSRLWVDGKLVIDNWKSSATNQGQATMNLTAGAHDIIIEYYDALKNANVKLEWSGPAIARQVLPERNLLNR